MTLFVVEWIETKNVQVGIEADSFEEALAKFHRSEYATDVEEGDTYVDEQEGYRVTNTVTEQTVTGLDELD